MEETPTSHRSTHSTPQPQQNYFVQLYRFINRPPFTFLIHCEVSTPARRKFMADTGLYRAEPCCCKHVCRSHQQSLKPFKVTPERPFFPCINETHRSSPPTLLSSSFFFKGTSSFHFIKKKAELFIPYAMCYKSA